MNMLPQLSPDVRRLVVALPYRVGYFISVSDQSGGDDADEAEQNALRNIVTFYVEDTVKSEFAHEVMFETLNYKAKWEDWKKGIEKVPDECQKISSSLVGIIENKEIIAYKQNLLEIAIVVAQAYREVDENSPLSDRIQQLVTQLINKMRAAFGGEVVQQSEAMLSVSPLERAAIKKLAASLSIDFHF